MIHPCDIELAKSLDSLTGMPLAGQEEEVDAIIRDDVWPAFFATEVGQELKSKYDFSQALNDATVSEMSRRFGVAGKIKGGIDYPGAFFLWRLEEIVGDFVRAKHPCLVPKVKPATASQPSEAEKFEALKSQVMADIENPNTSSVEIARKKRQIPGYKQAWDAVQTDAINKGYGLNPNAPAKAEAPSEIRQFAHLLNSHIGTNGVPRPAQGFVTLIVGDKRYEYAFSEFREKSNLAAQFGLIR
jgi:hypothetical protein